ncbi:MAG: DUF1554 domain-containing protein [bacterium]|nr:DUF1554 domain-containing protein [bacterium]
MYQLKSTRLPLAITVALLLAGTACSKAFPGDESALAVTMLAALAPPAAADGAATGAATIKKVFLSNTRPGGNMGGIAGADAICNGDANKPDAASYKALLVDGVNRRACVNANCAPGNGGDGLDWVFQSDTTYHRDDGGGSFTAVMTTNANRIAAFPLSANGFDASGANEYWTGLETDWTVAFSGSDLDCADWAGGGTGQSGTGGSATSDAISFSTPFCGIAGTYHLICVEQ